MNSIVWHSLLTAIILHSCSSALVSLGEINGVVTYASPENTKQLFVLPSLLIDPAPQLLTDSSKRRLTIPVTIVPLNAEARQEILRVYRTERGIAQDSILQILPVSNVRVTWRHSTSLVTGCSTSTKSTDNIGLFIVFACSNAENYHSLLSRLRLNPKALIQNLRMFYMTDREHFVPINLSISTAPKKGIIHRIRRSPSERFRFTEIEDDEMIEDSADYTDCFETDAPTETTTLSDFSAQPESGEFEEIDLDSTTAASDDAAEEDEESTSDGFVAEEDEGWKVIILDDVSTESTETIASTSMTATATETTTTRQSSTVSTSVAKGWDTCGGRGWNGSRTCESGYVCYARSVEYSECRPQNQCPAGWACNYMVTPDDPIPPPSIIQANHPCREGEYAQCQDGTSCLRRTAELSVCARSCLSGWLCQEDTVPLYGQCGGSDHIGPTKCADGLTCYKRSEFYSNCHKECPNDPSYECAQAKNA